MTTLITEKSTADHQSFIVAVLDFACRYSNRMEGGVKPPHSRAHALSVGGVAFGFGPRELMTVRISLASVIVRRESS